MIAIYSYAFVRTAGAYHHAQLLSIFQKLRMKQKAEHHEHLGAGGASLSILQMLLLLCVMAKRIRISLFLSSVS